MNKKVFIIALITAFVTSFSSCYYDVEEELYPDNCALDENDIISFSMDIDPIFIGECNFCHNANSGNIALDGYNNLSNYLDNPDNVLVCRIEGFECGNRMPDGGELSCLEIKLIKQWIEQGYPDN